MVGNLPPWYLSMLHVLLQDGFAVYTLLTGLHVMQALYSNSCSKASSIWQGHGPHQRSRILYVMSLQVLRLS